MRICLGDAMLGKVPSKTARPDTATRMGDRRGFQRSPQVNAAGILVTGSPSFQLAQAAVARSRQPRAAADGRRHALPARRGACRLPAGVKARIC